MTEQEQAEHVVMALGRERWEYRPVHRSSNARNTTIEFDGERYHLYHDGRLLNAADNARGNFIWPQSWFKWAIAQLSWVKVR